MVLEEEVLPSDGLISGKRKIIWTIKRQWMYYFLNYIISDFPLISSPPLGKTTCRKKKFALTQQA